MASTGTSLAGQDNGTATGRTPQANAEGAAGRQPDNTNAQTNDFASAQAALPKVKVLVMLELISGLLGTGNFSENSTVRMMSNVLGQMLPRIKLVSFSSSGVDKAQKLYDFVAALYMAVQMSGPKSAAKVTEVFRETPFSKMFKQEDRIGLVAHETILQLAKFGSRFSLEGKFPVYFSLLQQVSLAVSTDNLKELNCKFDIAKIRDVKVSKPPASDFFPDGYDLTFLVSELSAEVTAPQMTLRTTQQKAQLEEEKEIQSFSGEQELRQQQNVWQAPVSTSKLPPVIPLDFSTYGRVSNLQLENDKFFTQLTQTKLDSLVDDENNETFSPQNKVVNTTVRLPGLKDLVSKEEMDSMFNLALKLSQAQDRVDAVQPRNFNAVVMKLLVTSLQQLEKQRDSSTSYNYRLLDIAPLKEFSFQLPEDLKDCFQDKLGLETFDNFAAYVLQQLNSAQRQMFTQRDFLNTVAHLLSLFYHQTLRMNYLAQLNGSLQSTSFASLSMNIMQIRSKISILRQELQSQATVSQFLKEDHFFRHFPVDQTDIAFAKDFYQLFQMASVQTFFLVKKGEVTTQNTAFTKKIESLGKALEIDMESALEKFFQMPVPKNYQLVLRRNDSNIDEGRSLGDFLRFLVPLNDLSDNPFFTGSKRDLNIALSHAVVYHYLYRVENKKVPTVPFGKNNTWEDSAWESKIQMYFEETAANLTKIASQTLKNQSVVIPPNFSNTDSITSTNLWGFVLGFPRYVRDSDTQAAKVLVVSFGSVEHFAKKIIDLHKKGLTLSPTDLQKMMQMRKVTSFDYSKIQGFLEQITNEAAQIPLSDVYLRSSAVKTLTPQGKMQITQVQQDKFGPLAQLTKKEKQRLKNARKKEKLKAQAQLKQEQQPKPQAKSASTPTRPAPKK